ncbi:MAG: hypothetical protein WDM77_12470 [Steroidobacteraceae bacterium]
MKKQRVLVVLHSSLVPPDTLEGRSEKEIAEWRTEYDVISTLKARGHEVLCVGVLDSLTELRTSIADWKPDLVFNLLEEFDGIGTYDQHVVAFLELLRQPYTGCNPRGLLLSRDKPLSKQLLSYHRIPTPQFAVFNRSARVNVPRRLRFPPVREVHDRGCLLGDCAGLGGRGFGKVEGAHPVRPRPGGF